ncbi:MAG: N-acetylmuramoyl-L-alanine amidase [Deltaproteobacteria bacterium]|nr:N-acetylmuramoyl-L-alanine amidase [Deltaproteobacteria bacterium]
MVPKELKFAVIFVSVLMLCLAGFQSHAQSAKHVVVIDAAHGGEDSGVIGIDKAVEKDITLAIALAMQKELSKESNVDILLTRTSDKTLTLDERKKIIADAKPALVLSLHANGGFGKASSGFELYYPGFKGVPAQAKSAKAVNSENQYLGDSVKLAKLVQKNLDGLFPRKGRGLREAMVPLAEGLSVPVVAVELGFMTHPDDKKKLVSRETQIEIAKALARSIKSFF